jgi:peroxidase
MNLCIGIFVLVALSVSTIDANSSSKESFTTVLSKYMKKPQSYGPPPPRYKFKNSLLELPLKEARKAIAQTDEKPPSWDCPSYNNYQCDPYNPWRTIDGSCNNLKFPWWGAANTLYDRILPPAYGPYNSPRSQAKDGSSLENPRTIALVVNYPQDILIEVSNFLTHFGQFMFHDLSHFAETKGDDGEIIRCKCGAEKRNRDCINMPIPYIDYYNQDKKCLVQVRSRDGSQGPKCRAPYREQLNEITAWFDLSQVYGNDDDTARNVRQYINGRLRVSDQDNCKGEFLPQECPMTHHINKKGFCYFAGDNRVNQYPQLTNMHTLFMREHNRIADALWKWNNNWDDEFIYQLARTINIAEYQNILYRDYLPIIVGRQFHQIFDLDTIKGDKYFMGYNPYIFPNVDNEFSAAASRYGHALVIPYVTQRDDYGYITRNVSLWTLMNNPKLLLEKNSFESFLKGAIYDKANWFSPHLTDYLSNYVEHNIGPHNPSKGHSLSAWNTNRGRDHGVRPYNDYRQLAGLNRAKRWEDLTHMPPKQIDRLKQVYKSVDDIDLWAGGMSEYPLPDGIVGPTFAYILSRGMRDWKYGDRWYFENGHDQRFRLTMNQLREAKNANLARIICDNTGITRIPQNPFLMVSKTNPEVSCYDLPRVDLSAYFSWNDQTGWPMKK